MSTAQAKPKCTMAVDSQTKPIHTKAKPPLNSGGNDTFIGRLVCCKLMDEGDLILKPSISPGGREGHKDETLRKAGRQEKDEVTGRGA